MARLARVVVPGMPHHITQRGNRRLETFFQDDDYPWSSVRAHLRKKDDVLVKAAPLLLMTRGWKRFLTSAASEEQIETFRRHERTGRPLGDEEFLGRLEKELGRVLKRQIPGPKVNDVK